MRIETTSLLTQLIFRCLNRIWELWSWIFSFFVVCSFAESTSGGLIVKLYCWCFMTSTFHLPATLSLCHFFDDVRKTEFWILIYCCFTSQNTKQKDIATNVNHRPLIIAEVSHKNVLTWWRLLLWYKLLVPLRALTPSSIYCNVGSSTFVCLGYYGILSKQIDKQEQATNDQFVLKLFLQNTTIWMSWIVLVIYDKVLRVISTMVSTAAASCSWMTSLFYWYRMTATVCSRMHTASVFLVTSDGTGRGGWNHCYFLFCFIDHS